MARRAQRTQCHLSDDDHEEVAESDNFSGDEISEEANEPSMQTTADGMLQSLDDEALFGVVKKLVTYLDHLKTGEQHLPPALPRILVWKGNMIKEKCKADIVKGHTYGKLSFLPTKSTCYHKRSGSKTPPSPTDVINRLSFKKMLHSTVNENLSPKTLDDMTSLYMKHAAAPTDSATINAQSIICDVIGYFYHRAQEAHKSSSSQHEGNANINRDVNTEVHEKRPPTHVDVPVDMNKDTPYVFGSVRANHTNMNDAASGDTLVVPASGEDCSPTPDSIAETMKATESSSQQVYLSQGGRSQSKRRLSTSSISANNENVGCSIAGRTRSRQSSLSPSTSPNIAHQADFVDNPEAILRKRAKRLATRSSQQQETSSQVIATSDTCFDTITGHLSSFNASQAHLSKSPLLLEAGAKTDDVKQNIQRICNQKLKERYKRQKTAHGEVNVQVHLTHGVQLVEESSACNASADDAPPTVGYQECIVAAQRTWGDAQVQQDSRYDTSADGALKKASQLLSDVLHNADASPRGAHVMSVASKAHAQNSASLNHMLDPQVTNPKSTHLDPPSVNRVAKPRTTANLLDFSPPSFRLLEEDDDDHNFTPSHIASFNDPSAGQHAPPCDGPPCDGPILDTTPDLQQRPQIPLAAAGGRGCLILISSQEAPETPEVQITGVRSFSTVCATMSQEANNIYNEPNMTCYQKCESIGFRLGSSSAGKEPRRPRRFVQPNSYYRDFKTNECKARDSHPKNSCRHYFFSTVGDYLMNKGNEANGEFLGQTCKRSFTTANATFKFKDSEYLLFPIYHDDHWFVFVVALQDGYFVFLDSFFSEDDPYQQDVREIVIPNFVKAWDMFIGIDWNFHEFVVHHAPVPQHDLKYFSKYDDGIFAMKYLELWDPRVNLIQKFLSNHLGDIRIQYMIRMVYTNHNDSKTEIERVANHKQMLELKERTGFQPASSRRI